MNITEEDIYQIIETTNMSTHSIVQTAEQICQFHQNSQLISKVFFEYLCAGNTMQKTIVIYLTNELIKIS